MDGENSPTFYSLVISEQLHLYYKDEILKKSDPTINKMIDGILKTPLDIYLIGFQILPPFYKK